MKTHKRRTPKTKNPRGAKDIYAMRKRKKRKKVLIQCIWLLLLSMTVLVLYQRRDSWIPKLETMGIRHQTNRQGTRSEKDGNFPIDMYGDTNYQAGRAGDRLMVLNDSYLNIYDTEGALLATRQHAYGSAMLQTKGEYALVYEYGGTKFRLETPAKLRYEKKVADPIIFGRVSANGQAALVTSSDNCACRLLVFNVKGQQFYERDCVERISDVSFFAQGGGCYTVSSDVSEGTLYSVLHSYSFSQNEDLWSSQPLDMLAISVYNTDDGSVFVLGDTQSCWFNAEGSQTGTYVYPDKLDRSAFSNGIAALVFTNEEKRTQSVAILNGSSAAPVVRNYDRAVRDIGIRPEDSEITVMLRNQIEMLNQSGGLLGTAPLTDSCDGFLRVGGYLFLLGYDRISRMEDPGF